MSQAQRAVQERCRRHSASESWTFNVGAAKKEEMDMNYEIIWNHMCPVSVRSMLETIIYHEGHFDALSNKIEKDDWSLSGGSNGHRFRIFLKDKNYWWHIAAPAKEIRFLLALPGQLMIWRFGASGRTLKRPEGWEAVEVGRRYEENAVCLISERCQNVDTVWFGQGLNFQVNHAK